MVPFYYVSNFFLGLQTAHPALSPHWLWLYQKGEKKDSNSLTECKALGLTQFQLQGISHHPLASASTAFARANPQTCTYAGPYRLYLWNKPGSLSTVRGQTLAAACARSALPQTPRGFLLLHPVLPRDVTSGRSCSGRPPRCSAPHTASCSSQLSCEEGFPSPLRSCLVQSRLLVSS